MCEYYSSETIVNSNTETDNILYRLIFIVYFYYISDILPLDFSQPAKYFCIRFETFSSDYYHYNAPVCLRIYLYSTPPDKTRYYQHTGLIPPILATAFQVATEKKKVKRRRDWGGAGNFDENQWGAATVFRCHTAYQQERGERKHEGMKEMFYSEE